MVDAELEAEDKAKGEDEVGCIANTEDIVGSGSGVTVELPDICLDLTGFEIEVTADCKAVVGMMIENCFWNGFISVVSVSTLVSVSDSGSDSDFARLN